MPYIRRTNKRFKGTLREQFNYYKRQMKDRLLHEQAFKKARGVNDEININMLFEHLDYNEVFNEGITRKVGNKTIKYTGIQAIELQIESFRLRASKVEQANLYIVNYAQSLNEIGMPIEYISEIYQQMQQVPPDKLSALLDSGQLKQIAFVYASKGSEQEQLEKLREDILNALGSKVIDIETGEPIDWKTLKAREKFLYIQEKQKQKSGLF